MRIHVYKIVKNTFHFRRMTVQNMYESVYVGMCLKIGTPQQVASRRDIMDITDMLDNNKVFITFNCT